MPRNELVNWNDVPSDKEFSVVTKKALYTGSIGVLGAVLLGGESFSQTENVLGMSVPAPVAAGLGIAGGSIASNLLSDYVINGLFDQSQGVKQLESTVIKGGLAAAGSVGGMYYLSGVQPSLNGAILGVGSYVGGEFVYEYDNMLLGRLW